MINLKDNIWIEGFDKPHLFLIGNLAYGDYEIIYSGKTSEISEEIAEKYVDWMFWDEKPERKRFYNYGEKSIVSYPYLTAKQSIQSACDKEYCIIYKK